MMKLKFLLFFLLFGFSTLLQAQKKTYLNANWQKTTINNASYFRINKGNLVADYLLSGEKLQEVTYVNGKPEGRYFLYFKTGELKTIGVYRNGKREGVWKTFNKKGKIKEKGKYSQGEKVGIWKTYYKNI